MNCHAPGHLGYSLDEFMNLQKGRPLRYRRQATAQALRNAASELTHYSLFDSCALSLGIEGMESLNSRLPQPFPITGANWRKRNFELASNVSFRLQPAVPGARTKAIVEARLAAWLAAVTAGVRAAQAATSRYRKENDDDRWFVPRQR